ncbi:hypothetical protein ABH309_25135 [Chromobacterium piscinae]|uniref:Uncharacterized protein n=1 Tax=Chromobacterium piscinae TaxID=686831 RepID=A0ABV0HEN4_9NEIS
MMSIHSVSLRSAKNEDLSTAGAISLEHQLRSTVMPQHLDSDIVPTSPDSVVASEAMSIQDKTSDVAGELIAPTLNDIEQAFYVKLLALDSPSVTVEEINAYFEMFNQQYMSSPYPDRITQNEVLLKMLSSLEFENQKDSALYKTVKQTWNENECYILHYSNMIKKALYKDPNAPKWWEDDFVV